MSTQDDLLDATSEAIIKAAADLRSAGWVTHAEAGAVIQSLADSGVDPQDIAEAAVSVFRLTASGEDA